jgi:hypothetical protein
MTYAKRRALVQMVFGGTMPMVTRAEAETAKARGEKPVPTARRMGVYIGWVPGEEGRRRKRFDYYIRGHLIAEEWQAPLNDGEKGHLAEHYDIGVPPQQGGLTKNALY